MIVFLACVGVVLALLLPGLQRALFTNLYLNALIIGVFVFGIFYNFRQVLVLGGNRGQLDRAVPRRPCRPLRCAGAPPAGTDGGDAARAPRRLSLSAPTMRSLLDGIAARLDESRDLSRYMIGLLIFLGLLGTFWGLSQTVGAIGDVIRGLSVGSGDEAPSSRSSSRAWTCRLPAWAPRFRRPCSVSAARWSWASSIYRRARRRIASSPSWRTGRPAPPGARPGAAGDGEQSMPVYVQALLEQTAESLETLQRTLTRGEEGRIATNNHLLGLAEKIGTLTDQMRTEQ